MILDAFIHLVNDMMTVMPKAYDAFRVILTNFNRIEININSHDGRISTLELTKKKCEVFNSANVNIPGTGVLTVVPFNTEEWDNDEMHDNVVNNTRITFNTPGWYDVGYAIELDDPGAGGYMTSLINLVSVGFTGPIVKDSRNLTSNGALPFKPTAVNSHRVHRFNQGDYIELYVSQASGIAAPLLPNNRYSPRMWAHMVEERYNPDVIPGRYE